MFLSNALPGTNLDVEIYDALEGCKLAVLLAGATYGAITTSFSTYHELDFVLDEEKPFYLVKMCERWQEAHVRGKFGKRTMYKIWMPGDPMPDDLVADIAKKMGRSAARRLRGSSVWRERVKCRVRQRERLGGGGLESVVRSSGTES